VSRRLPRVPPFAGRAQCHDPSASRESVSGAPHQEQQIRLGRPADGPPSEGLCLPTRCHGLEIHNGGARRATSARAEGQSSRECQECRSERVWGCRHTNPPKVTQSSLNTQHFTEKTVWRRHSEGALLARRGGERREHERAPSVGSSRTRRARRQHHRMEYRVFRAIRAHSTTSASSGLTILLCRRRMCVRPSRAAWAFERAAIGAGREPAGRPRRSRARDRCRCRNGWAAKATSCVAA